VHGEHLPQGRQDVLILRRVLERSGERHDRLALRLDATPHGLLDHTGGRCDANVPARLVAVIDGNPPR